MTDDALTSRLLFDREVDRETLAEWTAQTAAPKPSAQARQASVLLVRAGREWIGIPASMADTALPAGPVHTLPYLSTPVFPGLCNVDGELLPCVDLAALLKTEQGEKPARARILAVTTSEGRFALRVDEVLGAHGFDPDSATTPPETVSRAPSPIVTALAVMSGRTVGVADEQALTRALAGSLRP